MPRRVEVPYDPRGMAPKGMPLRASAPENDLVALMEAPPHAPAEWSRERLLPMREVIEDAICAVLDERERFVFNSLVVERRSLRSLGRDMSLSKSQVDRIKQQAVAKLAAALNHHPLIREFLDR